MSIFNSLTKLITPDLISTASKFIGEDSSKVSSALTSMVPGLLSSFLQKGNLPEVATLLGKAAQSGDILSNVSGLFSGGASKSVLGIGESFVKSILGNKLSAFTSGIAQHSGVSVGGVTKLLTGVAPLVAGTLGTKMLSGGLDMNGLLKSVDKEKDSFMSMIPHGVSSVVCPKDHSTSSHMNSGGGNKGGNSWWKWLLGLLLLALIAFFAFRNCSSCNRVKTGTEIAATPLVEAKAGDATDCRCVNCACVDCKGNCAKCEITVGPEKEDIKKVVRPTANIKLPSGKELKAFSGGAEALIIPYLESNKLDKVATDVELDDDWFVFDNIDFDEGTSTLKPASDSQLDNIAEILKMHPHAKLKINAHTDKAGRHDKTLLTQNQADAVKVKLVHAGVDAERIDAKGLGDELAVIDADSHISKRANDRRVTFRFKK